MPQKSAPSWVLPATTAAMSRISQLSPAHYMPWPGRTRSSIGAPSARMPSTTLKRSSPLAPSLPSPTSAYLSASTWTRQLQALAQSLLKSGKARSASSDARLAPSTKRRKPTLPQSWNASPLFGPLQSSDHTSCPCPSKSTRITTLCNDSRQ